MTNGYKDFSSDPPQSRLQGLPATILESDVLFAASSLWIFCLWRVFYFFLFKDSSGLDGQVCFLVVSTQVTQVIQQVQFC